MTLRHSDATGTIGFKDISSQLKILSYLQVSIGFFALIITGALRNAYIIIIIVCLFVSWFLDASTFRNRWYQRLWGVAALLYLFYFLVDLIMISRSLIIAITHLLIFVQIYKLFNRASAKDYMQLYTISFFHILAASSLTAELSFFIPFVLYLANSMILFLLIHSHHHPFKSLVNKENTKDVFAETESIFKIKPFIKNKIILVITILLSTFILFILIPRFRAGYLRAGFAETQMVSGFSDRVILGELGRIKRNPNIVMRVQVSDKQDARRITYWRGIGLDYFDGYSWRRSDSREYRVRRNARGWFQVKGPADEKELVKQVVYLEPIGSRVIFVAQKPYLVYGTFSLLYYDAAESLYLISNNNRRRSYTVYSQLLAYSPPALRSASPFYSEEIKEQYLQLPRFFNPRIRQLALQATADADTVYDKAEKIESYLRKNYTYTTELTEAYSADPIYGFLFTNEEGHCEYFATAMVLMLRSIGIPARLVNGFQRGEYNELGGYFIVRQRDAHSWVEIYFPEHSWVEFDPTPEGLYSDLLQASVPFSLSRILDSIKLAWDRYVIFYNVDDQRRYLIIIRENIDLLREHIIRWLQEQKKYWMAVERWKLLFDKRLIPLLIVLFAGIFIILYSPTRKFLFRYLIKRSKDIKIDASISFYQKMLQILRKKGIKKSEHLTPLEFVEQVEGCCPYISSHMQQLTSAYYRCRYGNVVLDELENKRMKSLLIQLKKSDFSKSNK